MLPGRVRRCGDGRLGGVADISRAPVISFRVVPRLRRLACGSCEPCFSWPRALDCASRCFASRRAARRCADVVSSQARLRRPAGRGWRCTAAGTWSSPVCPTNSPGQRARRPRADHLHINVVSDGVSDSFAAVTSNCSSTCARAADEQRHGLCTTHARAAGVSIGGYRRAHRARAREHLSAAVEFRRCPCARTRAARAPRPTATEARVGPKRPGLRPSARLRSS